jgi:16S rRNA C1402 N4-methylase RsmH
MEERGLVKKVSFSSLEMSMVKKSFSAWLEIGQKKNRSPKSCQKIVKKLSNILSNLEN